MNANLKLKHTSAMRNMQIQMDDRGASIAVTPRSYPISRTPEQFTAVLTPIPRMKSLFPQPLGTGEKYQFVLAQTLCETSSTLTPLASDP